MILIDLCNSKKKYEIFKFYKTNMTNKTIFNAF